MFLAPIWISLFSRRSALALPALIVAALAHSQPSGGPYGPVQLDYGEPEVSGQVYFVAPDGDDSSGGTSVEKPTLLETAITKAKTGDAIVLRGGEYRTGNLVFNQGIVMQPYGSELPIIKGTRLAHDWESLRDGLWRVKWDTLFPMKPADWWRRNREAARTPLYKFNNDMVFADGKLLQVVGWPGELDGDSFYIDYEEGYVYIAFDPAGKKMEITAFDNAITRVTSSIHGMDADTVGPQIRGIVFTQYAYRAVEIEGYNPEKVSPENEHGNDVIGSVFEHCTFSFCSRVGGYFRGNGLVIRNCLVSDTSTEGIFVLSSNDVLLERNIITRNNMEGITGYYASAVKIFNQCYRVVCRENLVIDNPGSMGIWYDVGNVDGLFVNNWIQNTDSGFFFEISKGAICAGNVFVNCDSGIYVLNSERVRAYQNTLVNSTARFERTERSAVGDHFGWHPASGPAVDERDRHVFVGNLVYADLEFQAPLLRVLQREVLRERLTEPQFETLDYNVYVKAGLESDQPLVVWSPSLDEENLMELNKAGELTERVPEFDGKSQWFVGYRGPLFHGVQLGRFELLSDFPASGFQAKLPEEALEALGWSKSDVAYPGAFPVLD